MNINRIEVRFSKFFRGVSYDEVAAMEVPGHARNKYPLQHGSVLELLYELIGGAGLRVSDAIHGVDELDSFYAGALEIKSSAAPDKDKAWVLGVTNITSGIGHLNVYTGCRFFDINCIAFNHEAVNLSMDNLEFHSQLKPLLETTIDNLHKQWSMLDDREEAYKARKVTVEEAHSLLCRAIVGDVIAGRLASEFLRRWHCPSGVYAPRTVWSFYRLLTFMLSRLTVVEYAEHTIAATDFLDNFVDFRARASKWIQPKLF